MDKAAFIKQLESLTVGLKRSTVQLVDYTHAWSSAYAMIVNVIMPHLGDATINHIGSTAIPGSVAKPIIDVGIDDDKAAFEQQVLALESLGFTSKGEYGVKGRSFFTYYNDDESFDYIHLHAFKRGDIALKKYIAFRDAHINNQALLVEYNALKQDLVARGVSTQDYPQAKAAYIQKVLSLSP